MRNLVLKGNRNEIFEISVPAGGHEEVRIAASTRNNERMRIKVKIKHAGDNSSSMVKLFGAASDDSRIDFITELEVSSGLHNVEAHQHAHVLLLSPTAQGSAIPRQDVATGGAKAFHGASCTGIPQDKSYYLSTLGLGDVERREVLRVSHLARAFIGLPEEYA